MSPVCSMYSTVYSCISCMYIFEGVWGGGEGVKKDPDNSRTAARGRKSSNDMLGDFSEKMLWYARWLQWENAVLVLSFLWESMTYGMQHFVVLGCNAVLRPPFCTKIMAGLIRSCMATLTDFRSIFHIGSCTSVHPFAPDPGCTNLSEKKAKIRAAHLKVQNVRT